MGSAIREIKTKFRVEFQYKDKIHSILQGSGDISPGHVKTAFKNVVNRLDQVDLDLFQVKFYIEGEIDKTYSGKEIADYAR